VLYILERRKSTKRNTRKRKARIGERA